MTARLGAVAVPTIAIAFLASSVQAQVGDCMVCDYHEIMPCAYEMRGAEQCATQGPDDCDLYGDVCGMQALNVLPDGSITTRAVDLLFDLLKESRVATLGRLTVETDGVLARACRGEILLRLRSADEIANLEEEEKLIVL